MILICTVGLGKGLLSRAIFLIMGSVWKLSRETIVELFEMGSDSGMRKDQRFLIQKAVDYIRRNDPSLTLNVLRSIEEETIDEDQRIMSALQCSLDEEREKGIKKGRREGRMEGRMEGRREGRMEGHMEGHKEGTQEAALRMIQNGLDVKTICLCTGLTPKEVEKLRQKAKNIKA